MDIKNKTSNYLIRNVVSDNYLNELRKIPMLSTEEEKALFIKYEESQVRLNAAKGLSNYEEVKSIETKIQDEIRNEIITRNQRFNFAVAKRYDNNDIIMDLVSIGAIGMYEAFQKYNYKEGVRFCTFAIWYIRRAINHYLNTENLMVHNTNTKKLIPKVRAIESSFFTREGRYPSMYEIQNILNEKYNIKKIDISDLCAASTYSIDDTQSSDDKTTVEEVSDYAMATAAYNEYETTMNNDDLAFRIKKQLNALSERERIIICMSSGYGYNKEYKDHEIAEELDLTSERVRQLRHSARTKMMKGLSAYSKV